jgi:methyl-accepting chemotaxis protein
MSRNKEALKNYSDLAFNSIAGLKAEQAKKVLRVLRYGTSGYFWINDMGQPYPRMIMHPTIPSLNGKVLNDPKFNCAEGIGQNLFSAFIEKCNAHGEGYVRYLWPKPTEKGLTEEQPKLSYVRLYKPFNWTIGTGMYIDDIDALVAKERTKISSEASAFVTKALLISLVIIIAFYLAVSYFTGKYMIKPLALVTGALKILDHDLTVRVPKAGNDEIGELADWFNQYADKLQTAIGKLSEAAMGITSFSSEVSRAVEQQATVASEQSAAVAEITSTMEELSASSSQIADHSKAVVEIAAKTWDDTKQGASAVESVIMKMNDINGDNLNSIREIVELGRKSKEISKVMEIINTIADQTKLIAFNAALEASSAGEAGKRFGVVAVEIRRLADSVMESTGEIEGKINEIQEAINRLVISSEKGSKGIQKGLEHSSQTSNLLLGIVDGAQSTADSAKQISLSTQQQKTASSQVVVALREIVTGSSQTTEAISQISAITRKLSRLSDNLREMAAMFKVQGSGE